ncbi:hypothetical protein OIDMADRAFT_45739 [Oidiodendron maius Zn]|uniref:Major facilitator superfamily (MFS) profile domain-containing protein n=1 Tax=Oidiodendron maius (strain Zn) TaxID=913774 RepID=A0A0C3C5Z3_OIDMZ|nr:hypothetical protein OIDMADRAFT_45739 [Oidiodendron maius Zn]
MALNRSPVDVNSDDKPNLQTSCTSRDELSASLREYLLQRHGTAHLDPIPTAKDADPYNWPAWKKTINLLLVAFHAMMCTFSASAIIPAFLNISEDLGVSLQRTSYLTSLQIVILGVAPLFWKPLSNRFGRRPIFLISLICSLVSNIGCAKSKTFASMAGCRALQAFFISPPTALGGAIVTECFFKHERGRYMGVWTLMVTLGVTTSPLIFGFVTQYVKDYHWIYWILAITNAVQFILYIFFGPETLFTTFYKRYITFCRIDPRPLCLREFIQPLFLITRVSVAIPAVAYAMVFVFAAVLTTVEIPQLLQEKFNLSAQGIGLQFIPLIIGSVLGEQVGGKLSDLWMNRHARHSSLENHAPEYCLWLSYIGFSFTIAGLVVFLVQTQNSPAGKWNVTPLVGLAITAFGNQIIATILITYAVDCNQKEAASVGVCATIVRQIWAFIGPFWFPSMFTSVGLSNSAGIVAALIVGISVIPTLLLRWRGQTWRMAHSETESSM